MKPTISTSPLTWSCTTAGINPSNFEKSMFLSTNHGDTEATEKAHFQLRVLRASVVRDNLRYNKKPRHTYRRGLHLRSGLRLWFDYPLRAQSCRPAAVAVVMM